MAGEAPSKGEEFSIDKRRFSLQLFLDRVLIDELSAFLWSAMVF